MQHTALAGKRCLITGASRGLGRELAVAMAGAGCRLFLTARDAATLKEAASAFGAPSHPCDLENPEQIDTLCAAALTALGGIDILINCAGVFPIAAVADSTGADFDRCFAVNVRAPFLLSSKLAPHMSARSWGRIVNIGSSSSYAGFKGTSVYCASKHALLGLSRALHDELKGSNVRVFCISPGSIKTDMGRLSKNQSFETFLEPAEVAAFVVDTIAHDGPMIAEEVRLNRMVIQ